MSAQTVTQAVARRDDGDIVKFMWTSSRHLAAVLPEHVDVKSFLGTAAAALHADPKLMAAALAKPDTLMTALFRCAALGHQPGTDEYYLTIRKGGILGIEGYRGVIERMYRSGAVKSVIVREVCAKDKFKFVEGDMDKPYHHFGGGDGFRGETGADFFGRNGYRDRGPMVGVYAYAILMTGAVSRVVLLNRADVMAAREASDASESPYSPWNQFDAGKDHPEFQGRSMWWKTAARRLEPWVPTSAEYRRELMRAANAVQAAAADVPAAASALADPDDIHEAEIVEPEIPPTAPPETQPGGAAPNGTAQQVNDQFRRLGFTVRDKAEVLRAAAAIACRDDLTAIADLTPGELADVRERLAACGNRDDLVELLVLIAESRGQEAGHAAS